MGPKDIDDEIAREIRPRIGKRPRPADATSESPYRLLRRALRLVRPQLGRTTGTGRLRAGGGAPGRRARRVVVKASFVPMHAYGQKAASLHLAYIVRDGAGRDGAPGVLYGPDGPIAQDAFDQPREGEQRQFRIIISAEDGQDLDLTSYVRRVMARVGRDAGQELEWAAVNHHNTDHPHAHVVVRGVDRSGCEVWFQRAYISKGIRWRAQEIATEELGPRTDLDIRRQQEREVTQERFTSLDYELERRAENGRVVAGGQALGTRRRVPEALVAARLERLASWQLGTQRSETEWELAPGWQGTLRELSRRRDIIKMMHQAVGGDPGHYRIVRPGESLEQAGGGAPRLVGRLAAKALADERAGFFHALVETPDGLTHHVSLAERAAHSVRIGDLVTLTTKPEPAIRPDDRRIAALASSQRGLVQVDESHPDGGRLARRLRALETRGLVAAQGPAQWRVPADLLERLERHHAERPPRHRLFVERQALGVDEQARYRGPVWLDEIERTGLSPNGLGAEIQRALHARSAVLRTLGIDPGSPHRGAQLATLERNAIAEQFSKHARQAHAALIEGEEFRGTVHHRIAPSGSSFAVVSDGQRFLVLRTRDARQWKGKEAIVARDPNGRLELRPGAERGLE